MDPMKRTFYIDRLTAVRGYTQMLAGESAKPNPDAEQISRYVEVIENQITVLASLASQGQQFLETK